MERIRRLSPPPALAFFLTAAAAIHWGYAGTEFFFPPLLSGLSYLAVIALTVMNLAILHQDWPRTVVRALFMIALTAALSAFLIGFTRESEKRENIAASAPRGCIVSVKSVIPGRYYTKIAGILESDSGSDAILVTVKGTPGLASGDRFYFWGTVTPVNDGEKTDDQFGLYLKRQGFSCKSFVDSEAIVPIAEGESSFREKAAGVLEKKLARGVSEEGSGLLKALFLARRDGLSVMTTALFRKAGIMHLLAASGMHVGMITFLPLLAVRFFALSRVWALLLGGGPLVLYLAITGMPVSLARAGIMFFIYAVSRFAVKKISILQVLFLTGTILVILMPWELYSPGFQLSFGATLAIILFTGPFKGSLPPLPGWFAGPLAVSLAAQVAVIPLVAWHFQEIAFGGVIATMAASPLIALAMLSGAILAILPSWAGTAIAVTGSVIDVIFRGTVEIARFTGSLGLHYETGYDMSRPLVFSALLLLPLALPMIKRLTLAAIIAGVTLFVGSASIATPIDFEPSLNRKTAFPEFRDSALIIRGVPEDAAAMKARGKSIFRNLPRNSVLVIESAEAVNLVRYNRMLRTMPFGECRLEVPLTTSPGFIEMMDIIQREKIRLVMKK